MRTGTRAVVAKQLGSRAVIAVLRTASTDSLLPACEALRGGGIRVFELTMTTPGALAFLPQIRSILGNDSLLGMGSVLNDRMAGEALAAGADFIVTPILKPALVALAHQAETPIMLGAYTPSEAQAAHEAGADFVKIFPAEFLGPNYLRALKGPLPHLRLVPTGGVDDKNIRLFFEAGAAAVAVGSSLVSRAVLERQDWPGLKVAAENLLHAASLMK